MAEWSIAAVLKTVVLRGTRGSNPCLSAGYINKSLQKQCFAGSYHFLTFGSLTIKAQSENLGDCVKILIFAS